MYKADQRNPEFFHNGQAASLVLGQPKFTSNGAFHIKYQLLYNISAITHIEKDIANELD
jgi:hypothetical protein